MPSSSLHQSSDRSAEVPYGDDARRKDRSSSVRITVIVQNRYTFDTHLVTGKQIRETAGVPANYALYRRTPVGNEPIADEAQVELRNGDHFFARPSSSSTRGAEPRSHEAPG